METVKSLADSGVKFFDQGVAFQINALVNIREGVKKLSTELKEVVKEKEELQHMVIKLKAEKDILEKLLKNKLNEEKQSVAISNCMIVTDKFARSLSSITLSGGSQQDIDLDSVVVQDLIKKVRESRKKRCAHGGQDLSTSSLVPPDQPSFLALEKGSSSELRPHISNLLSLPENLQPSMAYTDGGKDQDGALCDVECDISGCAEKGPNHSQSIPTHQCSQSIATDSNDGASHASETCSVCRTCSEKSDEPDVLDMTVKAESSCYEEERPGVDAIERGNKEEEDLGQPEFGPEEELPFLVTPAEPAVGEDDPMEATMTMFVINEPMPDPPVTVQESGQATTSVSSGLDRVGYSKHPRTAWRGLDSRRSNTPIHVRRGGSIPGSPSTIGSLSARVPGGQRMMIPKYRSTLYHSPRPTSSISRPSSGNFEIPSSSLVNTGLASTSGTARAYPGLHQCDVCGKHFPKNENLLNHIRVHTGEKPFKCWTCGRNFSDGTNLRRHQKVHTGERPYGCSFCDKTFATSTNRNIHERIHTGEYPYRCRYCPKRFNRHGNLARHEKRHLSQAVVKGCILRSPPEVKDDAVETPAEQSIVQDGADLSCRPLQSQRPNV